MHPSNILGDLENLPLVLAATGEVLWLVTYVVVIIAGFRQKSYGIPIVAVCGNISWELYLGFYCPWRSQELSQSLCPNAATAEVWIWRLWFLLDVLILTTLLLYGKQRQVIPQIKRFFYPAVFAGLVLACFANATFFKTFHDLDGDISAYVINYLMSILFVTMALARPDSNGLPYSVAWTKMLGTASISVSFYLNPPPTLQALSSQALLYYLYIGVFLFDCMYIWTLHTRRKSAVGSGEEAGSQ